MYHYVDPQGREQGPFAYAHLAKWFKAGYLRPNLGCRRQDETTYAPLMLVLTPPGWQTAPPAL